MATIVHISDYAFQSLLISCIETFPSHYLQDKNRAGKRARRIKQVDGEGESLGLLFGQRLNKGNDLVLNVVLAAPMQMTRRSYDMVQFSNRHFERIRDVLESFPQLEFLGSFHSHPWAKDEFEATESALFSGQDEVSALNMARQYENDLLEVILGITALRRHSNREAKPTAETIQSYCGRFKYCLSAYYTRLDEDDNSPMLDGDLTGDLDNDLGGYLQPVDQLICPIAAHGGAIYANRSRI